MIRYVLSCEHGHGFEGWFSASADYDEQARRGLLSCPVCASPHVGKQIMAPAIARGGRNQDFPSPARAATRMIETMGRIRRHVEETFDYVGDRFAIEARAIHEGNAEQRSIYGEATPVEVKALVEDGVPVAPLPPEPPKKSQVN